MAASPPISIVLCKRIPFLGGARGLACTPRFSPLVRYLLSLSPRVSAKEPRQEALTLFHLLHGADLERRREPKHAGHQRQRGGAQQGAKALRLGRLLGRFGRGLGPDSTGVAPSGACRAILMPAITDARVVRSAPPRRTFFMPARVASMSLSASFRPPSLHVATVTPFARVPIVWKRIQASLRTRPRSLVSPMRATLGLRATSPKIVPPRLMPKPILCSDLTGVEAYLIAHLLSLGGEIRDSFKTIRSG